ncbi:hypothetical protein ACFWIW_29580 [Amycolatopsis sp. NPDC058340]|uniref:hypothetical protein n=1 Tax=Amycolatopsis sp. NPDC058340 TaxID=3346453 RepID=UPI0036471602
MRQMFADPSGRRRVFVRRVAISAGAAACYGVLLLVAFSGVPELPTALRPWPLPAPQATPRPPVTAPSTAAPPTPPPAGPRTASPPETPESGGAPEPVRETPGTSAGPPPAGTTASPTPPAKPDPAGAPDTRAPSTSPQPDNDRRNGRTPEDPPKHARTTAPKSGR